MRSALTDGVAEYSADWFQLIADNLPVIISYIDSDERFRYSNLAYETFFGRPREEVLGRRVRDVVSDKFYPVLEDKIKQVLIGERVTFESNIKLRSTEATKILSNTYVPHFDGDKVIGYFALSIDVSDQKRREDKLRLSEEKFRGTFQSAGSGMAIIDADANVIDANESFCDMLGYTRDELTKLNIADITHPDDWKDARKGGKPILDETQLARHAEKRYIHKSGRIVWASLTESIVKDTAGKPIYGVGNIQDVTKRRKAEDALRKSEERYRTIVEALDCISDGMEVVEANGRLLYCNTKFIELYPFIADIAVPGAPWEDLVRRIAASGIIKNAVDHEEEWRAERLEAFSKSYVPPVEAQLTDGRWLMIRNYRTNDGGLITVRTDITNRKSAEQMLHESQQRLQGIAENLFEGVFVFDEDGQIVFSNPSADTILGTPRAKSIAGKHIDHVFQLVENNEPIPFAGSPLQRVITDGIVVRDNDAVFVTSDNRSLMVAFSCSPLENDGKRHSCVLSFRDVKEIKEQQQETLQTMKLASVGELAAGIAHEINSPVQYIGDNLRFIRDSINDVRKVLDMCALFGGPANDVDLPPENIQKLRNSVEEADLAYLAEELPAAIEQSLGGVEQISRIVLAMKEFAHPGVKEKVSTDINKAIENTLTVSRNEWKHYAEIETDLAPELLPVSCLAGEINQVFLNLIINATHAIQEKHMDRHGLIKIATRPAGDFVEISISDNGSGIPDDVKNKIFDQFFTTKEVGKGTGLGLSVSRDVIVNKHGGQLSFDSVKGEGTTFTIRLPIADEFKPSEAAE